MDRATFSVKIEPEEDLEYNLHHEELEIKSETDVPIKSEECFKEEFHHFEQPEYGPGPITFPPIKEEIPKHQGNLKLASLLGQCRTSQTKNKELVILQSVQNKINGISHEKGTFSKHVERGGKRLKSGIIYHKRTCKEEGCSKHSKGGGKCIKHGGNGYKKTM